MLSNGVFKTDVLDHSHDELKILLVEDSESDAYAVRRFLEAYMKQPHSVVRVTTLDDAERAVSSKETRFDIVLLDLGLPDSSGNWETYQIHAPCSTRNGSGAAVDSTVGIGISDGRPSNSSLGSGGGGVHLRELSTDPALGCVAIS